MPNNCLIVNCRNREGKGGVKMFRIPTIRRKKESITRKRQQLWLTAINRKGLTPDNLANSHFRVCCDHFVKGRPAAYLDVTDPDWVPSLNLGGGDVKAGTAVRRKGSKQHAVAPEPPLVREPPLTSAESCMEWPDPTTAMVIKAEDLDEMEQDSTTSSIEMELSQVETVHADVQTMPTAHVQVQTETVVEVEVQTDLTGALLDGQKKALEDTISELVELRCIVNSVKFDESKFTNNDENTKFYTGLSSWSDLDHVASLISPSLIHKKNALNKFQEILLLLLKLRLGLPHKILGDLFHIDQSTVSRIFNRVLNASFNSLNSLVHWPERESLKQNMPIEFVKCLDRRVVIILDCFEIAIDTRHYTRPKAEACSNYRSSATKTVKYLLGIAPHGEVCYVSQWWDGKTSDRVIIEKSDFLSKLEVGDLVLAGRRSFNSGDGDYREDNSIACAEIKVPGCAGGSPLCVWEEEDTLRKVAVVRNHVERIVGCVRSKYSLLGKTVSKDYVATTEDGLVTTLDKIVAVSACLTNLSP